MIQGRSSKVTIALLLVIVVLGSVVGYQQLQISDLSRSLSHQSSEFANPTSSVTIENFTVTKFNATARPVMYLVFTNNGTTPANTLETPLVEVYANNGLQDCYNDTQSYFPLFSNESVSVWSRLNCGELGNDVVLTAIVDFLSSHGSTTKVYTARTTIIQSQYSIPKTVIVNQVGIKTYIIPVIAGRATAYSWGLTVTNESPTSIVAINETAINARRNTFSYPGCVTIGGPKGPYGVSTTYPLNPHDSCSINNDIPHSLGPIRVGDHFQIIVGIKFANGTSSSAVTTTQVLPPYAIYW